MSAKGPALIRLAHPLAFGAFLEHIGAPVDGYFERQGLPDRYWDPDAYVPLNRAWALFDDAARREGEDVAWHVGRFIGDHHLSAGLLQELTNAPSLLTALHKFIDLVNSEASHLRLGLIEQKKHVLFFTTGYFERRDEPGFSGSQAYQLEIYTALIRQFAGEGWVPRNIGVCMQSVPEVVAEHYPGCAVRLGQPFSYIAIERDLLSRPVGSKPPLTAVPKALVPIENLDCAGALSLMIRPYLPQGYPTIRFAASLLDVSPRTLLRRLSQCGTNYRALVDEVRFESACEWLRETDASVREIALVTGFSSQGNFSRFFRRVSGVSPRRYRQS